MLGGFDSALGGGFVAWPAIFAAANSQQAPDLLLERTRVTVGPSVSHVENQASALTDRNGNNSLTDEDPITSVTASNRVAWDRGVAEIPTVSATGLAAPFLLLAADHYNKEWRARCQALTSRLAREEAFDHSGRLKGTNRSRRFPDRCKSAR